MYLNEILPLGLGHERLKLRGGEGIDEAGFGYDEQKDLCTGEDRKLVRLESRSQYATVFN
jgi:hypothetical protein